jgi:tetratricopeptide (TPR) repeat protein
MFFLKFQIGVLKRFLGVSHPMVEKSLYRLYEVSMKSQNLEEAEQALNKLLKVEEDRPSPRPQVVADISAKLGRVISGPDRANDSRKLLERALQLIEQEPSSNKQLYEILESLAQTHRFLREDKKAESFQRRALEVKESELGPEHKEVQASLTLLGKVLCDLGEYDEAEKCFQKVLKTQENLVGKTHLDLVGPLDNLANLLDQKGEFSQAEKIYQSIVEIEKKHEGYIGQADIKIEGHRPPNIENTSNPGETYSR